MNNIVIGGALVLFALWYVFDVVKMRRQSFAQAVTRVEQEMARTRATGEPSVVRLRVAYPLSEHMVKRMAERAGFRFVDERRYNGVRALAFDPPKNSRKLSLND